MFADDVVIFASYADLSILFHNLNNRLLSAGDWYARNLLSLNEKKCQYKLFSRSGSQKIEQFSLYLNDRVLKRLDQFKYLGIIFDENLSFREHVKTVSLKIS